MPLSKCDCEGCELKTLFFENVSSHEIESMCTRKEEKTFNKGDYIIREYDQIKDFFYLKHGLVKLFRKIDINTEQIICFAGPLDFVNLLSIFSEKYYNYSVVAIEETTICCIDLNEIKDIARHNGLFASSLIEKVNKSADNIIITFLDVKKLRIYGRIAYMLLYFSEKIYKNNIFELPVSRKEIAEFIGMTTENVIRTLSELRKDGIIKIYGKTIEIIDTVMLKKIKEFS